MDVKKFTIEFVWDDKPYTVICDEFMGGAKFPQIFVYIKLAGKPKYFTLYKLPDSLFWFELLPCDEQLAYSIATVIGNKFSLQVNKRIGIQMEV